MPEMNEAFHFDPAIAERCLESFFSITICPWRLLRIDWRGVKASTAQNAHCLRAFLQSFRGLLWNYHPEQNRASQYMPQHSCDFEVVAWPEPSCTCADLPRRLFAHLTKTPNGVVPTRYGFVVFFCDLGLVLCANVSFTLLFTHFGTNLWTLWPFNCEISPTLVTPPEPPR